MAGMQGRLGLAFVHDARQQRTVMHVTAQQAPLRVIRAFPLPDSGVLVHLHNLSGGILGGDDLAVTLDVRAGARAQVTTTSATRIYRPRPDAVPARQQTTITVAAGGMLEYLPDTLIPFAGARYQQETHITLADDAGFMGWEVLAPGREARDECFAFDTLRLRLDICAGTQPLLLERVALEPHLQPLTAPARMGPYRYLASFYCCHPGLPAARWQALESQLAEIANQYSVRGACQWGVSALVAHGVLVRGLSVEGSQVLQQLTTFWRTAKRTLYDAEAIPPRKVP